MPFDPRLCNQAVLMFCCIIFELIIEVLPNWLIALFFSLDAHCAAGELDVVSQHCWFVCVSATQLFSTL